MNRLSVFPVAAALVLYVGIPAFAQHAGGFGGGVGKGLGGMPSTPGGGGRGNIGREIGSPTGEASKGDALKGSSSVRGNKTAGDLLAQNTKLSSNLQGLLPSGTNIQNAAKGFDHLGEFVAAVHVSHNLGIAFDQLKAKVTGPSAVSFGEVIYQLKPNVNAKQEAIKANAQALQDMQKSMASK